MPFVFVSYSHGDSGYAHKVVKALEKCDVAAWIDDRIDYGSQWPRVIQEKLDECSAIIVILTPRSEKSDWVQNEVAYAKLKEKQIFPLLVEGAVWLSLAATQYVDVRGGKQLPRDFLEQVARVVLGESRPVVEEKSLQVGDRVLANWSQDEYWYPATLRSIVGDRVYIRFDDGDKEWTTLDRLMPIDIEVGDAVLCKYQGGAYYYPARTLQIEGESIRVQYEYDETASPDEPAFGQEESTTISMIRVTR
jgi:hypothetical protein